MTADTAPARRYYHLLALLALFLLALTPRLYSALNLGWDWDYPGSFTLINFDEAGSCRAALGGFDYSTFIGRQTIAIADLLGAGPEPGTAGDSRAAKAYCHSVGHIQVARIYSAVAGALTVIVLVLIGLALRPDQPGVAWVAGWLLAVSGFHISESHSATVDAPSVFYIYAFIALMVYALSTQRRAIWFSPLLLVAAVWTKYWVFAVFAYLAVLPARGWQVVSQGLAPWRLTLLVAGTAVVLGMVTNLDFQRSGLYPLLALFYLLVPWRRVSRPMLVVWLLVPLLAFLLTRIDLVYAYTTSGVTSRFGSGYASIGWHKWLRNLLNVPAVLIVGLGLPACLFLPLGLRAALKDRDRVRPWLCLLPVGLFALFMAFLAPVTYYRHYLALLPAAALLAALGLYQTRWANRRWFAALFLAWPALLAVDMVSDYHHDPRRDLRAWYQQHSADPVFVSFYVSPPPQARNSYLFRPEFAAGAANRLRQARYLILSENWYDTAFANELNGPLVHDLQRLVKTRPEYARFYRDALAGRHPHLQLELALDLPNFMPELWLHKRLYGTFQLFVGDLRIFRVIP